MAAAESASFRLYVVMGLSGKSARPQCGEWASCWCTCRPAAAFLTSANVHQPAFPPLQIHRCSIASSAGGDGGAAARRHYGLHLQQGVGTLLHLPGEHGPGRARVHAALWSPHAWPLPAALVSGQGDRGVPTVQAGLNACRRLTSSMPHEHYISRHASHWGEVPMLVAGVVGTIDLKTSSDTFSEPAKQIVFK